MAEQKIKFKVSIKELSFEFEGTREVGQALQAGLNRSLGSLLDTQRVAMAIPAGPALTAVNTPPLVDDPPGRDDVPNGHAPNGHAIPAARAEKVKKPRKSGETAMTLLRGLIAEGFFKEVRTVEDIREKLRLGGHTNPGGLTARLPELAKKKVLFRVENKDGFIYKDTPFNDGPATSPPVDQPAE